MKRPLLHTLRLFPTALCLITYACGSSETPQENKTVSSSTKIETQQQENSEAHHLTHEHVNPNQTLPLNTAPSGDHEPVGPLTGVRTRVVWTQDVGDGRDITSKGNKLIVMGYDSYDGQIERALLPKPANYAKPLITPTGNRVVFTDRTHNTVSIVNWDGTGLRRLTSGFALAVWIDPNTKIEWVYVGSDPRPKAKNKPPAYQVIARHQIDRPQEDRQIVWDKRPVDANSFQLSSDGHLAGGLFPWPRAGIAELPNGSWKRLGRGCWTALAGDDSNLFWYFDGSHRHLTIVDVARNTRWKVNINSAPGINGYEVYHPKWTNDPRFLVMTGPYTVGRKANKIRGGGRQVEIYLGRFTSDFTAVEEWVQVTRNERADFFPDAWIDPSARPPTVMARRFGPQSLGLNATQKNSQQVKRIVVEARLLENTKIPTPRSIAPYRQALLVNEYEVVKVLEGVYQEKRILVAHWVIRNGQVLTTADREKGSLLRLALEAYDEHQELEGQRLVINSDAFNLNLYYDVSS